MSDAPDGPIRFRCPRCMTPLKAPVSRAGKRQRCPFCQTLLEVPLHSRTQQRAEEYPLCKAIDDAPFRPQNYIAVSCPICHTRIVAGVEQVGQKIACPDCGTRVAVPPPAPQPKKKPPPPVDAYLLCDEVSDAPTTVRASEQRYIPLHCPVCNTLMQMPEDQVGQQAVCPDCGTATIVPPAPPVVPQKHFRVSENEEYALAPVRGQPPPGSPLPAAPISLVCFVCGTRMQAMPEQVGQEIACPDCGILSVVPPPPERTPPNYDLSGEEYGAGLPIAPPRLQQDGDYGRPPSRERAEALGREAKPRQWEPRRPRAIRWPMLRGIYAFPLYRSVWLRCVLMTLFTLALAYGGHTVFRTFSAMPTVVAGGGAGYAMPLVGSMILIAIGCVVGAIWVATMSVTCLAIVQDTAAGNEQIENWPELSWFVDWIVESFYVVNSLLLSTLPGIAIAWAMNPKAPPYGLPVSVSVMLLFPIVFLSMLEAGSPLMPISRAVWWSFGAVWWAWGLFYVETLAAESALASLGWWTVRRWGTAPLVAAPLILVPALMIYFRLLGRVAWCCAEVARKTEADEDSAEPDEDEAI